MPKVFDTVLAFAVVMLLLSLIVTGIVQAVSALLDLRGKNLIEAVKLLIRQAAAENPDLADKADAIAARLVRHPIVATGYWQTAKALRSDEVVRLLDALKSDQSLEPAARDLLAKALPAVVPGLTSEYLAQVKQAAEGVANSLFPGDAAALQRTLERASQSAVTDATTRTRAFVAQVEGWFDTVMDRSSDWFHKQMRIWTVAAAATVAVLLQVDSLALLTRISSDDALRAALVARADDSLQLGDELLGARPPEQAEEALVKAHPDQADAISTALRDAPACSEGLARLRADQALAGLADEFKSACQAAASEQLGQLRERVGRAADLLQVDNLKIFAAEPFWSAAFWSAYLRSWRLCFGTLLSVVFLSFGAPFWFNALRQLVTLRPLIAGKVEASGDAARAAAGGSAKS